MSRPKKDTVDPISLRFRALRESVKSGRGWDDAEFYKQLDVSQPVWSGYENGRRPAWEQLEKVCIAKRLDASPTWLMFGIGPPALTKTEQLLSRPTTIVNEREVVELAKYDQVRKKTDSKEVKRDVARRTRRSKKENADIISKGKITSSDK